ncbi:MAG: DUF3307 domain-containing protein [Rhodobacter sp.]|nr:DUF3307 domain-containing protein [Rhodobacter sp.]
MIETFTALLFAHTLADFVFQPRWMVTTKRNPAVLLLHAGLVCALSVAAIGAWSPWIAALAAVHLAIDAVKTYGPWAGLGAFLGDQLAHLASLAGIAWLVPGLFAQGLWAGQPLVLHGAALTAGLILAVRAGGFAVGLLMADLGPVRSARDEGTDGLPGGGEWIGLLERTLIFVLMLADAMAGIGFLIAAKSILRFGAVAENRAASEYVIIGTLASFAWAIAATFAVLELADALPPIAVRAPSP